MFFPLIIFTKSILSSLSGAIYIILHSSFSISSKASLYSLLDSELFINRALTPIVFNASTWSFISDIKGEITIVIPSKQSAGTW